MTISAEKSTSRKLILASDRADESQELLHILSAVGDVSLVPTADIPDKPGTSFHAVVVDVDLRATAAVQNIRRKLQGKAYETLPRLFVLAESLHHEATQAWALGATDTIRRPLNANSIQRRLRAVLPKSAEDERVERRVMLNEGIGAAQRILVKVFSGLRLGHPLKLKDVKEAELPIIKAIASTSIREWLIAVGRHHDQTYRHCLLVTGFAVAFAQHLNMREADQRRLARAALLHDVGKAFIPLEILDKPSKLTDAEMSVMRAHPQRGHQALVDQSGYPAEMLDVVLHHHELLDGSGYPDGLKGEDISDIVRMMTIVDIFTALVEKRAYKAKIAPDKAFAMLEEMGGKLDQALLQAFRPVAMGSQSA